MKIVKNYLVDDIINLSIIFKDNIKSNDKYDDKDY